MAFHSSCNCEWKSVTRCPLSEHHSPYSCLIHFIQSIFTRFRMVHTHACTHVHRTIYTTMHTVQFKLLSSLSQLNEEIAHTRTCIRQLHATFTIKKCDVQKKRKKCACIIENILPVLTHTQSQQQVAINIIRFL